MALITKCNLVAVPAYYNHLHNIFYVPQKTANLFISELSRKENGFVL